MRDLSLQRAFACGYNTRLDSVTDAYSRIPTERFGTTMSLHMGTHRCLTLSLCLALALGISSSLAKTPEFEQTYNENFLRRNKLIGTKPAVRLIDAQGQPFDLSSAQGKYTVVVFGCLT